MTGKGDRRREGEGERTGNQSFYLDTDTDRGCARCAKSYTPSSARNRAKRAYTCTRARARARGVCHVLSPICFGEAARRCGAFTNARIQNRGTDFLLSPRRSHTLLPPSIPLSLSSARLVRASVARIPSSSSLSRETKHSGKIVERDTCALIRARTRIVRISLSLSPSRASIDASIDHRHDDPIMRFARRRISGLSLPQFQGEGGGSEGNARISGSSGFISSRGEEREEEALSSLGDIGQYLKGASAGARL